MKKFRIVLALAVISIALIAALQAHAQPDPPCVYEQQYYRVGNAFYPVHGSEGYGWWCFISPDACTYYLPDPVLQPDNYYPCQTGMYYRIF